MAVSTATPPATTAAVSSDHDAHSFRDFLDGIPQEIRHSSVWMQRMKLFKLYWRQSPSNTERKLITVAMNSIPKVVSFTDGIILISILVKVGIIDLDNIKNNRIDFDLLDDFTMNSEELSCRIDDNGRIISLSIEPNFSDRDTLDNAFDLPMIIQYLERLEDLNVTKCRSLPAKALASLQHLDTLELNECSKLLDNFPTDMELLHLETLEVHRCRVKSQASSFLTWMTTKISALKTLEFWFIEKNEIDFIFGALNASNRVCFRDTIKNLGFTCSKLNNHDLGNLVLDILPNFPNMSSLDLQWNEIHSIQPIVDRIKNDATISRSKSIRIMNLMNNPIMEKIEKVPMEKDAFLRFLQIFKTIHNLGAVNIYGKEDDFYKYNYEHDSDIEYALRMNHAGRSLVEVDGNNDDDRDRSVPLSLWPTLLERSYAKSKGSIYLQEKLNATGLYYLLREGPALIGRPELGSGTFEYKVGESNGSLGNDHKLNKKKKKGKNSLERKRKAAIYFQSDDKYLESQQPKKKKRKLDNKEISIEVDTYDILSYELFDENDGIPDHI